MQSSSPNKSETKANLSEKEKLLHLLDLGQKNLNLRTNREANLQDKQIPRGWWPPDIMQIIMGMKKDERKADDLLFYVMIINFVDEDIKTKDNLSNPNLELETFIQFLEKNIQKLPLGLQFKILVNVYGHWLIVDHRISEAGLDIFVLDAALHESGSDFIRYYKKLLKNKLQTRFIIYGISPHQEAFERINEGKVVSGDSKIKNKTKIQKDSYSCGIYTTDHAFLLSKIDALHHLIKCVEEKEMSVWTESFISATEMPTALSSIYRLTPSSGFLKNLNAEQKRIPIDKKKQTINQIIEKAKADKMLLYQGCREKGNKLLHSTHEKLLNTKDNDIKSFMNINLQSELQLFVDSYSESVNELISLIVTCLENAIKFSEKDRLRFKHQLYQCLLINMSEMEKLKHIAFIVSSYANKVIGKNGNSFIVLMTRVIAFIAFKIQNNEELWQFYQAILNAQQLFTRVESISFRLFSELRKNISLVRIEEVFKIQLSLNALSIKSSRDFITSNEQVSVFLETTRLLDKWMGGDEDILSIYHFIARDKQGVLDEECIMKLNIYAHKLKEKLHIQSLLHLPNVPCDVVAVNAFRS